MKTILKYFGGSHAYGLNTPSSDIDERGVFVHTDHKDILGLSRFDEVHTQNKTEDKVIRELRHCLNLLRRGNSECIEMLFLEPVDCVLFTPEWDYLRKSRNRLIDPALLYSCLRGYSQGERALAFGKRTGKLGGKRYEQVVKFGFSPKNIVQLLRLNWAGAYFFKHGFFPVRIKDFDLNFHNALMSIKTRPETWTSHLLEETCDIYEALLTESYSKVNLNYRFDLDFANDICFRIYGKLIHGEYQEYL
jgi:hypothetical protein